MIDSKDNDYESMITEQLKDVLKNDVLTDKSLSLDSINAILDILDRREPHEPYMSVEEAWQIFLRDYSGRESSYPYWEWNYEEFE